MKNLSVVLSTLSFAGVIILLIMHFSGAKTDGHATVAGPQSVMPAGKIAWVNVDTLKANYEILKKETERFKKHQEQIDKELESSYQQMESDAAEVQKKAQAQNMTPGEYQAAEKRLMQMQQAFETRKQSLTDNLVKEQDDFNKKLKEKIDAFLDKYNKEKHYDYILSYSAGGGSQIMYANKQLEITKEVIEGLNAASKDDDSLK